MRALWLRWTWRDFRARWVQIVTTAMILAVGIGAFAGLGGMKAWRVQSADESLAVARAHDLRVDLADGSFARAGRLRAAMADLPAGTLAAAEERLIAPSQVDASRPGRPVLVPARLIGIPVRPAGQEVDQLRLKGGRGLDASARAHAVLDWNFAHHYELPDSGRVRLAGIGNLPYTGVGVTPQHFLIVGEGGISGAESTLAVVYLPLSVAQRAAGRPDAVNELVLRVARGRSLAEAERSVRSALASALPGVGVTVTRGGQEQVTRILYRDATNDQKTFTAFAVLLLLGAALAAFNLISRVVEAQRREIGIGMALGVSPRLLAVRPLALGVQIGVLGALLGVPVGIGLAGFIQALMRDFLPLPVYASTFPFGLYAAGALIGMALPVLAASLPVRRAVGVAPIDAIATGHRAARGIGATAALRRLSLPGRALAQLPLRNLARTPRRTLMTVIGLGAVMTAVVGVLGMVDSIGDVADRQRAAVLSSSPQRLEATLTGVVAADSAPVREIASAPGVERAEPGLTVGAAARAGDRSIDLALSFVDPRSRIWHPQSGSGHTSGDGVLLAAKAADDLGVAVGDSVLLRHPRRSGERMALAETRVRVMGIHSSPIRAFAYMNVAQAPRLGLAGLANTVSLVPRPGTPPETIQRAFFGRPGIASVRPAASDADALETTVDSFGSAIQVVAFITLGLALLVAFTSTSVSVDERRREYATMFAFGLPPRAGLRVAMTESLVVGVLGTAVGVGLGLIVSAWIVHVLMPDTFPDLGAEMALTTGSVITTLAVGILAVTVAPLLAARRLRGMDIPSTLRVME